MLSSTRFSRHCQKWWSKSTPWISIAINARARASRISRDRAYYVLIFKIFLFKNKKIKYKY